MASPALKLSVAKVMSTASAGSGAVSRAMTKRPASRAFWMASTTEGPFGVIRMPLSPFEIAFSMAWIWVSSSPSSLPAASVRFTPAEVAASLAPSSIATKKGFVVVLTMRVTPTPSPLPAVEPASDEPGPELEQAVMPRAARIATEPRPMYRVRRGERFVIESPVHRAGAASRQRCQR